MSANGYDVAAEAPIINTYVPINFGELYKIGSALKAAVDEAAEKLNTALTTFGEFRSPSEVDIKRYYDNSIGKVSDLIEAASSNPDLMKDAGFRSQLQSRLNNIDYSLLSGLKESADNMRTRLKAKAELEAQGLYQEWFDDPRYTDLSNWDTASMGIMNNLAPSKFESLESIGSAYTKDLKPTFYKGQAPNSGTRMPYTNWMAISFDDIRRSLEQHAYDIKNTPAGQKWYNRMRNEMLTMNPNATQEDIDNAFINELAIRQSDKMIETPVTDNPALQRDLYSIRYGNLLQAGLHNLTELVQDQSYRRFKDAFKNITEQVKSDYSKKLNDVAKQTGNVPTKLEIENGLSSELDFAYKDYLKKSFLTSSAANNDIRQGIDDTLDMLSIPLGDRANAIFTKTNTQTGKMTSDGYRVGNNSSDFLLKVRLFTNVIGIEQPGEIGILRDNKLRDDFEVGKFNKFFVSGSPKVTTDGKQVYHNSYVYIPEKDITSNKYTSKEIEEVLGDWVNLNEDQVRITESTDAYGDTRTSVNTALKLGKYLRIPVNTVVPLSGIQALENDADWNNDRGVSQDKRDELQQRSETLQF